MNYLAEHDWKWWISSCRGGVARRVPLTLFLILGGCTSYSVSHLPANGAFGAKGHGVPITLSRPEFTVKKVEGSDPPRYEAGFVNVPDPHQRYAISLSPAWLSKVTFDAALTETGGLSSTSVDAQEQIGPAVTTLFSFVSAVAGIATKAAGGGGGGGVKGEGHAMFTTIKNVAGINTQNAKFKDCLDPTAISLTLVCALDQTTSIDPSCIKPQLEMARRERSHRDADDKDKGTPLAGLYAGDDMEKRCLVIAADLIAQEVKTSSTDLIAKWDLEVARITDKELHDAAKAKFAAIADADDVNAARALMYGVAHAATDPRPLHDTLAIKSAAAGWTLDPSNLAVLGKALMKTELTPSDPDAAPKKKPAEPVVKLANGKAVVDGAAEAIALDPGAWRARRLAALQFDMSCAQREFLQLPRAADLSPSPKGATRPHLLPPEITDSCLQSTPRTQSVTAFQAKLVQLNRYQAELVNMAPDYDRLQQLDAYLNRPIPAIDARLRLSPSVEYTTFSKEAAAIQTELATAVAATQGSAKDPAAEVLPPVSPWVSEKTCIAASKTTDWTYGEGANAPEFVVVLRRADDRAAIEPPTYLQKGCGQ